MLLAAAALAVFSWWAVGLAPFTATGQGVVVGAGVAAMGWGMRHRRPPAPAVAAWGLWVWAGLAAALAAWQLSAFVQHPRADHPTLSALGNTALEPRPVRAAAFLGWLVAAAFLARRGGR